MQGNNDGSDTVATGIDHQLTTDHLASSLPSEVLSNESFEVLFVTDLLDGVSKSRKIGQSFRKVAGHAGESL